MRGTPHYLIQEPATGLYAAFGAPTDEPPARLTYQKHATRFATADAALLAGSVTKHRGKGRGTPSRRYGNTPTDWRGIATGKRERERRERQIANGMLQVSR